MSRATNPVGYFVHHQGRGHAERAASIANALAETRDVTLFCAREDIFPDLAGKVTIEKIPSLFERPAGLSETALDAAQTPDTLHCAPLGWPTISQAVATLAGWFAEASPSLFITDVSAELGQLARIASIPHLAVLQHGLRDDPGHMTAYRSAVALLAPYHEELEQPDRPGWMRAKTIHAPGVGIDCSRIAERDEARRALGFDRDKELVVVVGGGGGNGLPSAPLTLGARDEPDVEWVTLGKISSEWHETPPANLQHLGWVDNAEMWIGAADRVVSSCGNTTVHMVACAGKPWVVVPEWRYFDEQVCKAEALDRAGVAALSRHWPSSAQTWRKLWHVAGLIEPDRQKALVAADSAQHAAGEINALIERIWAERPSCIAQRKALA